MHVRIASQSAIRGKDGHVAQRAHDRLKFKRFAFGAGKLDAQGSRGASHRRRSLHREDDITRRHHEGVESRRGGLDLGLREHHARGPCIREIYIDLEIGTAESSGHIETPEAVITGHGMKVGVVSSPPGLTEMQVDLPGMGERDLVDQIGLAIILDEPQLALGSVRRKSDLEFDGELQGLRRIEVGLLVHATEFHLADDDRLVVGMQERALGVGQGAQAEERRDGQDADEQDLPARCHRAFVPAVPESLSNRPATSSVSKEGPSLR